MKPVFYFIHKLIWVDALVGWCQLVVLYTHICWENSINRILLNDYWCTLIARNMARAGDMLYIVRAYLARRQFGVNWHIYMYVEDAPWHIIVRIPGHQRHCWHVTLCIVTFYDIIVKIYGHSLMGKNSLVERIMIIPHDTIEGRYCSDGEFILSATFLVLVCLKDY